MKSALLFGKLGEVVFQIVGPATIRMVISEDLVSELNSAFHLDESVKFVELDHARYSGLGANAIRVCSMNTALRPILEWFTQRGWFVYKSSASISTLVRNDVIPSLWHQVTSGRYLVNPDGLIYTLDTSNVASKPRSLVVVFSSMSLPFDDAGLSRYFQQNFATIGKHLGSNVVVLRIADLDGVVGGFYSPTKFDSSRHLKVQSLIRSCVDRYEIEDDRVVLYGASKGGTGALLHGLLSDRRWGCVAVDPVVDDAYYETRYSDSHWTGGDVFASRKVDLFDTAVRGCSAMDRGARVSVVSSPRSPLFPSINALVERMDGLGVVFCKSHSPNIEDHPDVSVQTLRQVSGILNVMISGVEMKAGTYSID